MTDQQMTSYRNLSERWANAEQERDYEAFGGPVVDEFKAEGPRGFLLDKDEWLQRYRTGRLKQEVFEWAPKDVREFGDTVMAIGTQSQKSTYDGSQADARLQITQVAVSAMVLG